MESKKFIELCKNEIASHYNSKKGDTEKELNPDDVLLVWYSKSLQNHKGLFITPFRDGLYFELTYNGDKSELYFDAYAKYENKCIAVKEENEK